MACISAGHSVLLPVVLVPVLAATQWAAFQRQRRGCEARWHATGLGVGSVIDFRAACQRQLMSLQAEHDMLPRLRSSAYLFQHLSERLSTPRQGFSQHLVPSQTAQWLCLAQSESRAAPCPVPLQVHGPFQMLNIINFLVFRVTRTVLYSLEAVLAPASNPTYIVSPRLTAGACMGSTRFLSHSNTTTLVQVQESDLVLVQPCGPLGLLHLIAWTV
jgi:hypothetical protein